MVRNGHHVSNRPALPQILLLLGAVFTLTACAGAHESTPASLSSSTSARPLTVTTQIALSPIPAATLAPELSPIPKPNLTPAGDHSIYVNEVFGYHLTVPAEATITEGGVESFPNDELPAGMTFETYLAQLRLKYPGKLCVAVRYQLWGIFISAPPNRYARYAPCGTTRVGDYEVITRTEAITIEGRSYTAMGWEVNGPGETLARHYEFFRVTLTDGTEIEYGSWPEETATYADYLKMRGDLLQTVTSYAKIG